MSYVKKKRLLEVFLRWTVLGLRNETVGSDFFGICEQPQNRYSCINPAWYIRQKYSTPPDVSYTFSEKPLKQ